MSYLAFNLTAVPINSSEFRFSTAIKTNNLFSKNLHELRPKRQGYLHDDAHVNFHRVLEKQWSEMTCLFSHQCNDFRRLKNRQKTIHAFDLHRTLCCVHTKDTSVEWNGVP